MTTILVPYHHDERLPDGGIDVKADVTVRPEFPDAGRWPRLAALCSATADAVAPVVAAGAVPTVLSGDCLVLSGTLAGAQRAGIDPAVVWFDAHGDLHTLETTTSGYLGGLSLRLVLGAHPDLWSGPLGLRPVAPGRAVLVDARDLDPAEADFLAGPGAVRRIPVDEVDGDAVPDGPLVLHIDVDVVDPADLPGLLFPAPGGPPASAVIAAYRRLLATGRVVAVDIACPWHPAVDDAERAGRAALLADLTAPG
ncbi:arginase family protein [Actinoplanes sp. NPDC049668]|uniref:arginase family protein n=1 Tax=unclassified Actinoplanes TaxID=2626549 RepID=UPI0033BB79BA